MTYADVNSVNFDLGYTGLYGSGRFTSIHYGAAVGYKYGSVVAVRLSYEGAPTARTKGIRSGSTGQRASSRPRLA